jgi:hypothetical protein
MDDAGPRMGGIALKNGLILLTERYWSAAVRETDGTISVASGKKVRVPGSGGSDEPVDGGVTQLGGVGAAAGTGRGAGIGAAGIPLLRGLGRFGESLLVLGLVKAKLPQAELPLEGGRVAAALGASLAATSAVRKIAPKSAFVQEAGAALAAFVPAVLAVKNSAISGYHGAEHKVIGGREAALRAAAKAERGSVAGGGTVAGGAAVRPEGTPLGAAARAIVAGDSAAAAKEHDRCGSNLVGPYLLATVATNLLARGRSGRKSPAASAAAGAASLGIALEALRWANKHADSILARLMLSPGRAIQKVLTTSEPTPEQLEVGERALAELMRLENAGV